MHVTVLSRQYICMAWAHSGRQRAVRLALQLTCQKANSRAARLGKAHLLVPSAPALLQIQACCPGAAPAHFLSVAAHDAALWHHPGWERWLQDAQQKLHSRLLHLLKPPRVEVLCQWGWPHGWLQQTILLDCQMDPTPFFLVTEKE